MQKIAVFGLGYVGLPTAVIFSSSGFNVIGVDIDKEKVELLNNGRSYIREPHLEELLKEAVSKGAFKATLDGNKAVREANAIVIAVPTPERHGTIDLTFLQKALEVIRNNLRRGTLVIVESTIPPGTTLNFIKPYLEESGLKVEEDFFLAHVPERIAPGKAIDELVNVPRVVGGVGPKSTKKAFELYSHVNQNLLVTDVTTAEFVKIIENTYRDLNIAYANLLALIAEKIGIDVNEAIRLANTHPRVNIHSPGAGVGGPCLTKDPYFLIMVGKGIPGIELIKASRMINDNMPYHMVNLVIKALRENNVLIQKAKVAVLGVAYKGGVDDTRESPAKIIIRELLNKGINVVVWDPYSEETFGAERARSLEAAVKNSDAIVIVTDHPEFRQISLEDVGKIMRTKVIVDGRRIVCPKKSTSLGFKYYGVGFGRRR